MKNKLNLLLISMITLGCGKKTEDKINLISNEKSQIKSANSRDLEAVKLLLKSEYPNLTLAEYFLGLTTKNLNDQLDPELKEFQSSIKELQNINSQIKKRFLFNGQNYEEDQNLYQNSIISNKKNISHNEADHLEFVALNNIKNKHLNEIIIAFDKRVKKLSQEIELTILKEISQNNPSLVKEIEKNILSSKDQKVLDLIKTSFEFTSKMDELFRKSNLNESEQYFILTSELIATGIYQSLKRDKTFSKLISDGKEVLENIQNIHARGKEFLVLTVTLEKHFRETDQNIKDLTGALSETANNLNAIFKQTKIDTNNHSKVESKKILNFLYKSVILGENTSEEGLNSSVLSRKRFVDASLYNSINAIQNLNNNLTNILKTTNRLSHLVGIKPSKDLEKIISKAQLVSEATQTVKNVITGWATGGPMGVITALSVSPIPGLTQNNYESEKLEEISQKLNVVISNQKEILNNQIESMKMIRNLALLIDQYHKEEMLALSELRDISLVNLETSQLLVGRNIKTCEQIINKRLSSINKDFKLDAESIFSRDQLIFISKQLENSFTNFESLKSFMNSNSEEAFASCASGLAEAFSGLSLKDNPIRNIFNSTNNQQLNSFHEKVYLPLLDFFNYHTQNTLTDSIPLHIPSSNFLALNSKESYFFAEDDQIPSESENYELESLISVKSLEKYSASLLLFYPFLDIDQNAWKKDIGSIVNSYLANTTGNQSKSFFYLKNALKLTQSAIAQEALLSGEPLFKILYTNYSNQIFSNKYCQEEKLKNSPPSKYPILCSVRLNKLLMKNYLSYSLLQKISQNELLFDEYSNALNSKDALKVAYLLGTGITKERIRFKTVEGKASAFLSIYGENNFYELSLPSMEELKLGKITYSENLETLISIQENILNHIVKVTPIDNAIDTEQLIKLIIMSKK